MSVKNLKKTFKENKAKKINEACVCPSCGTSFIKTIYQQAFCKTQGGTVCKDKYWNMVTPTKRNNTTRISPANKARQDEYKKDSWQNDIHPFSIEGHGQWDQLKLEIHLGY